MTALYADESILVGHVILEPGEELAEEVHAAQSETILVVHGEIWVNHMVKRQSVLMSAAHQLLSCLRMTYIEANIAHVVGNRSTMEPVEYIAVLRRVS